MSAMLTSPSDLAGVLDLTARGGGSCRLCGRQLTDVFVDLGMSPPCESYVPAEKLESPEVFYPLRVWICAECLLVQLPAHLPAEEIFSDYAYFSSYSTSWVEHARVFTQHAAERAGLTTDSLVVEVASNDGYLLQHLVARSIPVLGIEPAANIAAVAVERGVPTHVAFLGEEEGRRVRADRGPADLVVANNVFAHVPDVRDFSLGLAALLADDGWLSIEVPHLMRLIEFAQYDTIYHEHFQYYSLLTAQRVLATAGLVVVDVEELASHGGSLRIWARHEPAAGGEVSDAVRDVLAEEERRGLHTLAGHCGFAGAVAKVKRDLVGFLLSAAEQGKRVAGYGAPGKGNTLLNHCGIRSDLVRYTVDRNPFKQGKYLPGTHIPILAPEAITEDRPDYVLLLPWNLRAEITQQLAYVREWGGRIVVPIPRLAID
ncbi:class I SAM-dependent methyltransferase [Geodermatophilus obscurus]|uniref:class I SAM-dependent methyltransferase n=1 Tax=Geodermatophilus obscurus TaxID=1861 RepID=UPI00019B7603|nr:class I SAM-dependent methyltransferase [Geodermatophilus obscurus]